MRCRHEVQMVAGHLPRLCLRQDGAPDRAAVPTKSFTGMSDEPAGFSCTVG